MHKDFLVINSVNSPADFLSFITGYMSINYYLNPVFLNYKKYIMEFSQFEFSEHILESRDVDTNSRLTIVAFCNYMQNLAGKSAEKRGFGITFMRQYGFVWVLVKVRAKISKYPFFSDKIKLETWVKGINRIVSDRHFIAYDSNGKKIADAITEWALLDVKSRRPQIIEKYFDTSKLTADKSAEVAPPEKIIFPENLSDTGKRAVVYSDIDLNGHVSNIKYPEWFLDTYDFDFLHNNTCGEFELNFLNESKFGQVMKIQKKVNAQIHYGNIIRENDGKEVFRIRLKWK
jgi:acyl-ACP thioesterase